MLERWIDLRSGEGPLVARAFAALFSLIAGHTILETARDALFLEKLPASRLALVYLALAVIGLVLPAYNTRFARSFGRRNAVVFTLMLAAFGTTLWHFQRMSAGVVYGLYVWSGLLGTVLAVQFWMFASQLFTVPQGKRLFPGIAAGGVLGAVCGGLVATAALELGARVGGGSNVSALLLVAAAFFVGAGLWLTAIPTEDVGTPFRAAEADIDLGSGLAALRDNRYVRLVAGLVALSALTLLATDYLFKYAAKSALAPSELGRFFARYYAVLNALALAIQLLVARRLMQRIGVVGALALLPLLLFTGATGLGIAGGAWLVVLLTKGADGVFRHSLYRVASELLYMPLPPDVRDRAKSLVDAVFQRGAQALGAGGILVLSATGLESTRVLALLVAVLALGWLTVTLTMQRGYTDLLRRELGRGAVDSRLLRAEDLDVDSVESVMAALSSAEESRVLAAIDLLVDAQRARLVPALILYHESDAVVLKALDILARIDQQDWRPHAARLARSASVKVRAGALRALGRACEADLVRAALDDPSPEVRAHAAFQLARCEGAEDPSKHPAIRKLLAEASTAPPGVRLALRLGLLDALREDADDKWVDLLLGVAQSDAAPGVVEAVAQAVLRVPDPRFVPTLVARLDTRDARVAVRDALVRIGEPAFAALAAALDDPATPLAVRRQIPITIASFGSQRAADLLQERLAVVRDGLLRYRVLRGLGRLVSEPGIDVDRRLIEAELEKNLIEHLRMTALLLPLGSEPEHARGSGLLLRGLLEDKLRQAMERAFRLFKILRKNEDVRGIFLALGSQDKRQRGHAVEFMEVLSLDLSEKSRELLRIVADDLPRAEKVARAASHLGETPADAAEALRLLLADKDDAVVALAAYHATALRVDTDLVRSMIAERPWLRDSADAGALLLPELMEASG